MEKLKILFMGTPDFSVNVLEGLINNYDLAFEKQTQLKIGFALASSFK